MISVAGIFTIRQEKKHETTPFLLQTAISTMEEIGSFQFIKHTI